MGSEEPYGLIWECLLHGEHPYAHDKLAYCMARVREILQHLVSLGTEMVGLDGIIMERKEVCPFSRVDSSGAQSSVRGFLG